MQVVGDEILLNLGSDGFQHPAQVADDRVIAQQRMAALQEVPRADEGQRQRDGETPAPRGSLPPGSGEQQRADEDQEVRDEAAH